MCYLELSDEEMNLLKNTVEYRLKEIRDELAHTENREFHEALRGDLERLEKIENRICSLFEGASKEGASSSMAV